MQKRPSVTIFVSVKNAEWIIKECVDSLIDQSYPNKEIYIIDNMSTDRTFEILKTYGKKIKLERVAGWVPKVHNHALKKIKTDFIAYTDADCVAEKDWIEKLMTGFTSDNIVGVAGYAGTPRSVNKLQKLIGKELESRWKKFPEFITRAPTINLCVRSETAKKVKFDEKFFWAWETDFGYRMSKLGKIRYLPGAVVYHYHRATFKGFFKQQLNNAKIQPFLWKKHWRKIVGDHISTSKMGLSLLIAYITVLSLLLGIFFPNLLFFSGIFFVAFMAILIIDVAKMKPSAEDAPLLLYIFIVRTAAWMIGIPIGMLYFLGIIKKVSVSGYGKGDSKKFKYSY
ncbi:hypothetical protein A3K63_00645 [Candidatus Micrarchaeota archaeon RBG_16_49_10]|nr:MAG: hypothetical protein A3K63_00645 [Candidatus Micrarchaeota archaeon RBG_16_49_10]